MHSNSEALNTLWYWIREREAIRIKKEAGEPRPWTKDYYLNTLHFCNVRREDDRGTKEIRALSGGFLTCELPTYYTGARLLNYAPSIEILISDGWAGLKKARDIDGAKIFHTAYVVSTCGQRMDKLDYVQGVVEEVNEITVPTDSLAKAHDTLMGVAGLGSFLAGQIVADLKNDRYLVDAHDWWTWSAMGPGSQKGLDFIFGKGFCTEARYEQLMGALRGLMPEDIRAMQIHMQDLQNCLCEFSKYWRHKKDLGGRRRNYHDSVRGE
jgi:hypothetical protein